METTHSKNSRTKKPAPKIVVNEWDDIWRSFNADNEKTTIEAMNADGWKTVQQAADDSGISRPRMGQIANEGKLLEKTKKKIYYFGKIREMVFVRPKI
jgi:hypothetical protein